MKFENLDQIISFFELLPTSSWTEKKMSGWLFLRKQYCALGHLFNNKDRDDRNAIDVISASLVSVRCTKFFKRLNQITDKFVYDYETWCKTAQYIIIVNDGFHPDYSMYPTHLRVIKWLEDLKKEAALLSETKTKIAA